MKLNGKIVKITEEDNDGKLYPCEIVDMEETPSGLYFQIKTDNYKKKVLRWKLRNFGKALSIKMAN